MTAASRIGLSLAMGALLAACDPIMSASGVVRTVPEDPASAGADPYAGGTPVSDAQLTMLCPDAEPEELAVTSDDGRVDYANVGMWPTACTLRVEAPDYYPQSFPIEELCVLRSGTSCHYLAIYAELLPRASPSEIDDE